MTDIINIYKEPCAAIQARVLIAISAVTALIVLLQWALA